MKRMGQSHIPEVIHIYRTPVGEGYKLRKGGQNVGGKPEENGMAATSKKGDLNNKNPQSLILTLASPDENPIYNIRTKNSFSQSSADSLQCHLRSYSEVGQLPYLSVYRSSSGEVRK